MPVDNPLAPPVIEPAKPTMIEGGFWGPGLLAEDIPDEVPKVFRSHGL